MILITRKKGSFHFGGMAETERNERVEAIVEALSLAPHLARRLEAMVWDGDAQALALAAIWRDLST